MAKLSFVRGAATGKMGEFVGAKWKGINYIRLYAKPANPRTEGQISIRLVFKALSDFASALFGLGLLELIPPARRMTERNSVFKANKKMLTDKMFRPAELQVSKPNFKTLDGFIEAQTDTAAIRMEGQITTDEEFEELTLHYFLYDTAKGLVLYNFEQEYAENANAFMMNISLPPKFNTPEGSQKSDCRLFAFIAGTGTDGKKIISKTFSCAVS